MWWRLTRNETHRSVLRKECERLLADLPLPEPFDIESLVRNMQDALGRQIVLIPLADHEAGPSTACGLRVKTPELTFVLYRQRASRHNTDHVILHELSHEWFDHGTTLTREQIERFVPARIRQTVLERFPGALVQGRANYDTPEEQQAELSAYLIKRSVRRRQPVDAGGDDMVTLLEHSLSHPVAPPRRGRTKS